MKRECNEAPPGQLLQAIREFNRHEWFECHETVEDLWIGEVGEVRNFYQGLIQIAVALHHWRNGNFGGAVSLLKQNCSKLSLRGKRKKASLNTDFLVEILRGCQQPEKL